MYLVNCGRIIDQKIFWVVSSYAMMVDILTIRFA